MELNLKYYNGKDSYSDGDVEDKIIDFIKKYPNNYEEAFKEDSSWPVIYHLSDVRKNVIRWYPFKENASILEVGAGMGAITDELCRKCEKVTSIELSKKRATAILERNKDKSNLEIIVGNFKDIKLDEKYDYILLNGVLEYSALYINSNNPYEDFINKLKGNLKKDGIILIAIENRYGLKYWCGANEDHTGIPYDGINNYIKSPNIKTFNYHELESIAKKCNMNINFYYMFPDYKFPKVIYTDKSLEKNVYSSYSPYYCSLMNVNILENNIFRDIYDSKMIPMMANSYFLELSNNKKDIEIEFVKFNNEFRKKSIDAYTYLNGNKYFKKGLYNESLDHIRKIYNIGVMLKERKVSSCKMKMINDSISFEHVDGENLNNILIHYYNLEKYNKIYEIYENIFDIAKKSLGKKIKKIDNNIFNKYNVKYNSKDIEKLNFYDFGLIDLSPSNIIINKNDYVLIDQEWLEENVPLEFVMYRSIICFTHQLTDKKDIENKLFKKYNIKSTLFEKLEFAFQESLINDFYPYFVSYMNNRNYISNVNEIVQDNNNLSWEIDKVNKRIDETIKSYENILDNTNNSYKDTIREQQEKYAELERKYNTIVNSKRFKILQKMKIIKK